MLNWIHSHTTNLGPTVSFDPVFVVCIASLEHWFFCSSTSSNLTNHSSTTTWHNLLSSRGKLHPGSAVIDIVADDDGVVSRSPSKRTPIADILFHVADNGSLRNRPQGQHVTHSQIGLLSAVNELSRVHTFGRYEELLLMLVTEWVPEGHLAEGSAASRVVYDVRDNSPNVAIALAIVEASETCRSLPVMGVGFENGACSLSLCTNNATHVCRPEQITTHRVWICCASENGSNRYG